MSRRATPQWRNGGVRYELAAQVSDAHLDVSSTNAMRCRQLARSVGEGNLAVVAHSLDRRHIL
jgi:hypothetical protein